MQVITSNDTNKPIKTKRIEGLDFLKGFAILWVVLEHALPMSIAKGFTMFFPFKAVPVFFSITLFLMFKKFDEKQKYCCDWYKWDRFWHMFKKVFIPFFLVFLVQLLVLFIKYKGKGLIPVLYSGGYGPGAYYPWVYLQMWFLAPVLFWIVDRKKWRGVLLLLVICVALNLILSNVGIVSAGLYRLLAIRYFFLAAIAYIWLHHEDYNKFVLLLLGFASLLYLWYFRSADLTPIVYNVPGWTIHNYPGYFFTLVMIVFLLAFAKENKDLRVMNFFKWCGENSWYIFLSQMFIMGFFHSEHIENIISNSVLAILVYMLIVFALTLGSVYLYMYWAKVIQMKRQSRDLIKRK
jgi:peptidoglycan/LPS O-acetylase OafA/YrhL